jgi:YD repeat-containing protein
MREEIERNADGTQTVRVYDDDGRLVEKRHRPARRKGAAWTRGGVWRTSQSWAIARAERMKREGVK